MSHLLQSVMLYKYPWKEINKQRKLVKCRVLLAALDLSSYAHGITCAILKILRGGHEAGHTSKPRLSRKIRLTTVGLSYNRKQ